MPSEEDLERRFTYHAPDEATRRLHDEWRANERAYARLVNAIDGGETREKSLALTALEEATFWVHAHIARNLHEASHPVERG